MSDNITAKLIPPEELSALLKTPEILSLYSTFTTGFTDISAQKEILAQAAQGNLPNHDMILQGGYPNSGRKAITLIPKKYNTVLAPYRTPFRVVESSDGDLYSRLMSEYPIWCGDLVDTPVAKQIVIYNDDTVIKNIPLDNNTKLVDTTHLLIRGKTDTMELFEASTRLDALTSAIWKVSRSSIIKFIKAGLVSLDTSHTVIKPDKKLSVGDIIYCDNKGRAVITAVNTTKNNRFRVSVVKYM